MTSVWRASPDPQRAVVRLRPEQTAVLVPLYQKLWLASAIYGSSVDRFRQSPTSPPGDTAFPDGSGVSKNPGDATMKLLAIITALASAMYFVGLKSSDFAGEMSAKLDQRMAQIDKMSE